MKFEQPVTTTLLDKPSIIGRSTDRYEGKLKTTGTATYAYESQSAPRPAYGYILGAGIAKGAISALDTRDAESAPGVLAVITYRNAGTLGVGAFYVQRMLAAPDVEHYHQPVAVVVAETFEQARTAAGLVHVKYSQSQGRFDLSAQQAAAPLAPQQPFGGLVESKVGDFESAFDTADVKVDGTFVVPDQAHAMMEPHATIALWEGERLSCWTSIQQMNWGTRDLAMILGVKKENIRLISPFIGGGFGGKGTVQSDLVLAAVAARVAQRPVKMAMQRPLMFNNTIHRPKTIQRVRLAAKKDGQLVAIGHESWSGNLSGGRTEPTTLSTRGLYASPNRLTRVYLAELDLAEGNAMRAPGEAPGLMALEIAMDELAEKLGIDPVEFRIQNDTQVDPEDPNRPFSSRKLVECLKTGAERFGWDKRVAAPGHTRDGHWLKGLGMASAIRGAPISRSGARLRLDRRGVLTVETDMTDIGTGSYTIVQQTAAELMGLPLNKVVVKLGDSAFPETPGSGGQQGAPSVTAGVYAACSKLREAIATRLGLDPSSAQFNAGEVRSNGKAIPLVDAVDAGELVVEEFMEFGDLAKRYAIQTFGAHFAEVAVHVFTGEIRVRRVLSVCAAGRILNPKTARSQVIGGITMGIGAALMEEMAVDSNIGLFVNHDLAGYEVPVHADIPEMEVVFIDELDPMISPLQAKGVGELGLTGVAPAIANAVYNATGARVREYPITLDKIIASLPSTA